jgi:ABC-type sugar transport system substrate-binding protein
MRETDRKPRPAWADTSSKRRCGAMTRREVLSIGVKAGLGLGGLSLLLGARWAAARPPTPASSSAAPVSRTGTKRIRVTFINPGISNANDPTGEYWLRVSAAMEAAAAQLNIDLEVIHSERDHLRMQQQARDVAKRSTRPDYLIVVNEKLAADEMVKAADESGIKAFVMQSTFAGDQAVNMGAPREKYKNWIGSLVPDNMHGGYLAAKRIIDEALQSGASKGGRLRLFAIAGDPVTQASVDRVAGLKRAISEYSNVDLQQIFMGLWRYDVARDQARIGLGRYPDTGAVWAANDPMALGVLEAAIQANRKPGTDFFVGGLGWAPSALKKVKEKALVTSVGGLHMNGALALVLLNDYHLGRDFAEEGVTLKHTMFAVLDSTSVDAYLAKFGDGAWKKIDFTKLSKVLNPRVKKYDFGEEIVTGIKF